MKKLLLPFLVVALTGCATSHEDPMYPFKDGWVDAEVVDVVAGSQLSRPNFFRCTRNLEPEQRAAKTFVELSYRMMSRRRVTMVELPAGMKLTRGQKAMLKLSTCENAVVPHPS